MRLFRAFGTVVASLWAVARAADEDDEHVVVLTGDNFKAHIDANNLTLVEFYAPWCGHCKRLAPEYSKAAEELKGDGVPLAKVDATEENSLASEYKIRGFPTLLFFRNGSPSEYTGGRTKDGIVQWVRRMSQPAITEAATIAEAQALVKNDPFAVVATVTSVKSDNAAVFTSVAESNRVAGSFVRIVDPSATEETVRVYRAEDSYESDARPIESATQLEDLVKAEKLPFFGSVSGENFKDYVSTGKDLLWFAGPQSSYDSFASSIRAAATQTRSQAVFLWLDTEKFGDHAARALGTKDYPALIYQRAEDSSRYNFAPKVEGTFNTEEIVAFVADVAAGKVEKSLMSEPIPESNDEPVKVVVGKTFEEIVLDQNSDVLLEVYAPWCGHCKNFEPIYTEFATKVAKNSHLVVAKMDGTANEAPVAAFDVRAFPTVFFKAAGEGLNVEQYDGPRTVQGLMDYIKSKSSKPIVVADSDDSTEDESNAKDEL